LLRLSVVVVAVAILALLVPSATAAAAASTPATPAGTSAAAPAPAPSLPIDLDLGGLSIKLNIPLSLTGLLGLGGTPPPSTTPPSTPPPSTGSTPPPKTGSGTPTRRPTPGSSAHHTTTATHRSTSPPQQINANGGGQPLAQGAPTTHARTHHRSGASKTPTAPRSTDAPGAAQVLARRLVPIPGPGLLIALIAATALGVAFVVRMSGRRGERRG
jgi:hypothetical protein